MGIASKLRLVLVYIYKGSELWNLSYATNALGRPSFRGIEEGRGGDGSVS